MLVVLLFSSNLSLMAVNGILSLMIWQLLVSTCLPSYAVSNRTQCLQGISISIYIPFNYENHHSYYTTGQSLILPVSRYIPFIIGQLLFCTHLLIYTIYNRVWNLLCLSIFKIFVFLWGERVFACSCVHFS